MALINKCHRYVISSFYYISQTGNIFPMLPEGNIAFLTKKANTKKLGFIFKTIKLISKKFNIKMRANCNFDILTIVMIQLSLECL